MADIVDAATRSRVMSCIRKKWTTQERKLHGLLKARKVRHKMHPELLGSPDVLIYPRILVFLDGCFWHGCPRCYTPPESRQEYWHPKIAGNKRRDRRITARLRREGWTVVRIWEHSFQRRALTWISRMLAPQSLKIGARFNAVPRGRRTSGSHCDGGSSTQGANRTFGSNTPRP
jgi:DNA mismatch endonuclease (patch repair protein)